MSAHDYLSPILERKRVEVVRRKRHSAARGAAAVSGDGALGELALRALRRAPGEPLRVIAEIKRRSPSAGVIRARAVGDVPALARAYTEGGAAAISVLCDGPGFGGSALDLRRARQAVATPLLFKEFVLDEVQVALARAMGANMVLLLVRALSAQRLQELVDVILASGMAPLVEAADDRELDAALATQAVLLGVNARDLRTFRVDGSQAASAIARIPADRIAIHMSGVHTPENFAGVAQGRADAVLIGEGLMRAADPAARLRELRG